MKFTLKTIANSNIRQGKLGSFSRLPEVELETPLLLFYTRGGSLPHITREVMEFLTHETSGIHINLPTTINCYEGAKAYEKGIAPFVGLKEMLFYSSVQDSAVKTPAGYNTKDQISVWSHKGRVPINVNRYMEIMETFQPEMYEALSNGDTCIDAMSRKRTLKVVESTQSLLDKCLEIHKNSSVLNSKGIFGALEGGYDIELRKTAAQIISSKPVDGFIINGLHNNGPEVEKLNFDDVKNIIEAILPILPSNKPRILHGCWRPEIVLQLVDMGIDIFDSSLAYLVTERKSALIFNYTEVSQDHKQPAGSYESEMHLADERYKDDFSPILSSCECLTCKKHTRAYVYHLIDNNELLAHTLLMLHNFHHYMEFFKAIRRAASQGNKLCLI